MERSRSAIRGRYANPSRLPSQSWHSKVSENFRSRKFPRSDGWNPLISLESEGLIMQQNFDMHGISGAKSTNLERPFTEPTNDNVQEWASYGADPREWTHRLTSRLHYPGSRAKNGHPNLVQCISRSRIETF